MKATSKDFVLAVYENAVVIPDGDLGDFYIYSDVTGGVFLGTGPTIERAYDAAEEFIIESQSREYSSENA